MIDEQIFIIILFNLSVQKYFKEKINLLLELIHMTRFNQLKLILATVLFVSIIICNVQAGIPTSLNSHNTYTTDLLSKITAKNTNSLIDQTPSITSSISCPTISTQTFSLSNSGINNEGTTISPLTNSLINENNQGKNSVSKNYKIQVDTSTNTIISKETAISIAISAFDNLIVSNPPSARLGRHRISMQYVPAWSVTIEGSPKNVPSDSLFVGRAGGTVVINALTGDVIDVYQWR
jgi:hypothetical protein